MNKVKATSMLTRLLVLQGALMLVSFPAAAGKISLSAGIDKNDIRYEDSLTLSLEIRWEGKVGDYRFELLPLPTTHNLKLLGTSSAVSSDVVDGIDITSRSFKYTLQPTKGGTGIIEPLVLKYISLPDSLPGELSSQQFQILIREPVPVESAEGGRLSLLLWAIPVLLVISAAAVITVRRRKRTQNLPTKSAEELLLEALSTAKKESLSERKLFFTRLFSILSHYLDSKLGLKTAGRTASEIVNDLAESPIPEVMKAKIAAWLTQAEKEKYAPLPGEPGDMLRLVTEIENLFEQIMNKDKAEAK